jgi:regulatory protein
LIELQWGSSMLLRFSNKASILRTIASPAGPLRTPAKQLRQMARKPAHVRLMNKAVDYLGRYASSRHKLAQILQRFAVRKLEDYDAEDVAKAIQQTIDSCARLGYLDDRQFAVTTARSQRRLGRSQAAIRQRLRQHALDDDTIKNALLDADENADDGDLQAAIRFAQRRRLGPFATRSAQQYERYDAQHWRQRELGALARAGFSMAISRQILECATPDDVENLLRLADLQSLR